MTYIHSYGCIALLVEGPAVHNANWLVVYFLSALIGEQLELSSLLNFNLISNSEVCGTCIYFLMSNPTPLHSSFGLARCEVLVQRCNPLTLQPYTSFPPSLRPSFSPTSPIPPTLSPSLPPSLPPSFYLSLGYTQVATWHHTMCANRATLSGSGVKWNFTDNLILCKQS